VSLFEASLQLDQEGRQTLVVLGDLDLATAHQVVVRANEWLVAAPQTPISLDLAGVTFLDSTGLGALLQVRNIARAAGTRVEVLGQSAAVGRVLELAGLTGLFDEPAGEPR